MLPALRRDAGGRTETRAAVCEAEAIVRVLRAFEPPEVPAPLDAVAPARAAANRGPESVPADLRVPETDDPTRRRPCPRPAENGAGRTSARRNRVNGSG